MSMDATFQEVLRGLPTPLQDYGHTLPYRLGLTQEPAGAWEEFWVLDINRDLPGYVAEDPEHPGTRLVSDAALGHYRAAHHCAAIHGLIADRLVDRQVDPDMGLLLFRGIFLRQWERELTAATGDRQVAREALARALTSLRRGTALELRTMARRELDPRTYALQTREKLRWGGTAARCLLRQTGQAQRAELLERSYDLFCFALQCMDDALDCAEDERTRGVSVPSVLGLPSGSLVRAMPALLGSAITLAREARLERLASWLGSFSRLAHAIHPEGDADRNEELGRRLAVLAEGALWA